MQSKRKNTIFAVMKPRNLFIGLVFLLAVLTACDATTREARRMVKRAERLADTLPDSTARLIDSVLRMPASFSERERMDMALLQADALFGDHGQEISPIMDDDFFDDHANLSTSPELERAAAYYARKKQYGKAAHAALYSGFVQQHYDEKEAAMRSFKEAEQYGGLVGDSLTVAMAEYWMGKMLINDGMEHEALNSFFISETNIGNHYGERALIENSKAVVYILMSQYDSAGLCLQQSSLYADKGCSKKVMIKIHNNYSVYYRIQGKYDQAIASLHQIEDDNSLDDSERLMLYLNYGKAYFYVNKMDSVAKYYQRIEAILSAVDVKKETAVSAYEALSHFAENQNDAFLALQYRDKFDKLLYDVMVQRQEQVVYRIQQQYDYESLQNEMNKKIIRRHFTILIVSLLLLITTIIILILQFRHKQLLKSEEQLKQQMNALKQDLLKTVKTSTLDYEVTERLRLILLAYRTAQRAKDPKKEWQPLVIQLMNNEQEPFKAARSFMETVYPRLYSTILKNYPDLTETEAKVCLLSCSDLSNKEIAEFLGLKPNTVNQNRSNLRKKLDLNPEGIKEQLRATLVK